MPRFSKNIFLLLILLIHTVFSSFLYSEITILKNESTCCSASMEETDCCKNDTNSNSCCENTCCNSRSISIYNTFSEENSTLKIELNEIKVLFKNEINQFSNYKNSFKETYSLFKVFIETKNTFFSILYCIWRC